MAINGHSVLRTSWHLSLRAIVYFSGLVNYSIITNVVAKKKPKIPENFPIMPTFTGKLKFCQKISQMAPSLKITLGLNPSRIFIQHPKLPLWPNLVILIQKMEQLRLSHELRLSDPAP